MEVGICTSSGLVRDHNEDAFWADKNIFVVCDGMGGHQAGEVASSLAIEVFKSYDFTSSAPVEAIKDSIFHAHARIKAEAEDPNYRGMGTTATLASLIESSNGYQLDIGHVGDSRAYLMRDGSLVQVTKDHSLVGELLRNQSLSKAEAINHPHRHVVTQALGIDEIEIDIFSSELASGDQVLLCTDGLSDVVEDQMIATVLLEYQPEDSAQRLVDLANAKGGPDNITVIVIKIP